MDGWTDRHEILHTGSSVQDVSSTLLGRHPEASSTEGKKTKICGNFGLSESHLMAHISKTVSRSLTCQLELSARQGFYKKGKSRGGSPSPLAESIMSKNILDFFIAFLYHHL